MITHRKSLSIIFEKFKQTVFANSKVGLTRSRKTSRYARLNSFVPQGSIYLKLIPQLLESLEWFGDERKIFEALPHFKANLELSDFRNVLAHLNFSSKIVKIDLQNADPRLFPALFAPNKHDPFLLLESTRYTYKIYDPRKDVIKCIQKKKMLGKLVVFERVVREKSKQPQWFGTLLARFKNLFIQALIISLLCNMLVMAMPLFIMSIYDTAIPTASGSILLSFTVGIVVALCGLYLIQKARSYMMAYIAARIDYVTSKSIIKKILNFPPQMTETASLGEQLSRVKNFESIKNFFSSPLLLSLFDIPYVPIFLLVIYFLVGPLVLIPLCSIVLMGVIAWAMRKHLHFTVGQKTRGSIDKHMFQLEALTHLVSIKHLGAERVWQRRYREIYAKSCTNEFNSKLLNSIFNSTADMIVFVTGLSIIAGGSLCILNATCTMGAVIASMILSWRAMGPFKNLFVSLSQIENVISNIKQINKLMNTDDEQPTGDHSVAESVIIRSNRTRAPGQCTVEFDSVSFRYASNPMPALFNVNFRVNHGEVVCIVGKNGSGKSTLVQLIPQLYRPQAGIIRLHQKDMNQFNPIDLRSNIAYLPQKSHLFYGTIAQNLRLAEPMASDQALYDALQLANVYDEVMALPDGVNTRIRDQFSETTSDSFIQRLHLARTYVKNASIMILDEPTSGLDQASVDALKQAIALYRGERTIFLVTHRASHLQLSDRIFYMAEGHLKLQGTPDQMLSKISSQCA